MSNDDVETRDVASPTTENAESVPAPEQAVTSGEPAAPQDAVSTDSAPDGQDESADKATLLSHVEKVVEGGPETGEPDTFPDEPAVEDDFAQPETPDGQAQGDEGADAQSETEDSGDTELSDDVTDDELKHYSNKAQRRIRKLVNQRKDLEAQVQQVAPLQQFVAQNNLGGTELSEGLTAMAHLKAGDFEGFLSVVGPYVRQAQEYLGHALPPDLEDQVRQGQMTSQSAAQMARTRMDGQLASQRAQEMERQQEQSRVAEHGRVIGAAVDAWEADVRKRDPDYDRISPIARGYVVSLQRSHGVPETADDAVKMATEAYRLAKEALVNVAPAPQPTPPKPQGAQTGGGSSMRAQPKTLLEAATAALMAGSR